MKYYSPMCRDPFFMAALCVSPLGWILPAAPSAPAVWWIILTALAEEVVFRATLQEMFGTWLSSRFPANRMARAEWKAFLPGTANIITSAVFATLHLFIHPPLWSLGVFVPSLVYGLLWDRSRSIAPCWIVHAAYNLCYFYSPF